MSQSLFATQEPNAEDVCKLCRSSQVFGELASHAEIKTAAQTWTHLRTDWQAPLCEDCFDWTANVARDMVTGQGGPSAC